jgi:hypothetical protein
MHFRVLGSLKFFKMNSSIVKSICLMNPKLNIITLHKTGNSHPPPRPAQIKPNEKW